MAAKATADPAENAPHAIASHTRRVTSGEVSSGSRELTFAATAAGVVVLPARLAAGAAGAAGLAGTGGVWPAAVVGVAVAGGATLAAGATGATGAGLETAGVAAADGCTGTAEGFGAAVADAGLSVGAAPGGALPGDVGGFVSSAMFGLSLQSSVFSRLAEAFQCFDGGLANF